MSGMILGLLAETFIHPGSGQSEGAIDLPVAREAGTDYPYVPGSGVKGALRDAMRQGGKGEDAKSLFGVQENAGRLLVSDARLLLLPVRSLTGAYKWLTCPHLIERFARDRARSPVGGSASVDRKTLAAAELPAILSAESAGARLFLEERCFAVAGPPPQAVVEFVGSALGPMNSEPRSRLTQHLAIVDDDEFAWFARYALAVQARNSLMDKEEEENAAANSKTSKALWYEETLPPDTVMYLLIADRLSASSAQSGQGGLAPVEQLWSMFAQRPYLQLGGNETLGQGWFKLSRVEAAT